MKLIMSRGYQMKEFSRAQGLPDRAIARDTFTAGGCTTRAAISKLDGEVTAISDSI